MTPDQTMIVTAINYLSGGLAIQDGTKPLSDSAGLERKLGLTAGDGPAYEQTLVDDGVIRPLAGYYMTPRYTITDAGRAYIIMAKAATQAWTPDQILQRMPQDTLFAGNHLSFFNACNALVSAGLATTSDGGGSFTLV